LDLTKLAGFLTNTDPEKGLKALLKNMQGKVKKFLGNFHGLGFEIVRQFPGRFLASIAGEEYMLAKQEQKNEEDGFDAGGSTNSFRWLFAMFVSGLNFSNSDHSLMNFGALGSFAINAYFSTLSVRTRRIDQSDGSVIEKYRS